MRYFYNTQYPIPSLRRNSLAKMGRLELHCNPLVFHMRYLADNGLSCSKEMQNISLLLTHRLNVCDVKAVLSVASS